MPRRLPTSSTRERKSVAFEVKSLTDAGEFVGLASVYGVRDLQGDIVQKGAFTKSIEERGDTVPILWQHDATNPIGSGTVSDSAEGLVVKGQLDLDTDEGKRAYSALKKGYVKGLSIGYDVVKQKYDKGDRLLNELTLWEISTVTFPANIEANVTAVKGQQGSVEFALLAAKHVAKTTALKAAGEASLQDRLCALYDAVQDAFPLAMDVWVVDAYDDHVIVANDGRYFSIAVTWDDDGDGATLGEVTEVEKTYVPVRETAPTLTAARSAAFETKVGREISAANAAKLKAAHEHLTKAKEHVADVMDAAKPQPKPKSADDETVSALKSVNDQLRRLTA